MWLQKIRTGCPRGLDRIYPRVLSHLLLKLNERARLLRKSETSIRSFMASSTLKSIQNRANLSSRKTIHQVTVHFYTRGLMESQSDTNDLYVKDFGFPFTPYAIQERFMHELYGALESSAFAIFESPTGTVPESLFPLLFLPFRFWIHFLFYSSCRYD